MEHIKACVLLPLTNRDAYNRQQQESSHIGDGARSELHRTESQDESHDRQQPESEAEARPDQPQRQEDGRADIEAGADSRTTAVEAEVRPEWPAEEAQDQHSGHVQHPHRGHQHRGHHLEVPHDERAYSDSEVDPNAILPDPRHRQRRPDWSAAAEARGRQEQVEDGVEVTPAAHSRDEVRDQHVKPPVIVTDQYGRRYLTKVENGETIYYADPHTQDTTAEQSEQSAGEEGQQTQTDAERWRAVESQQPQDQQRHPGQPYDPRRAKVEEQRRALLEERRRAQEEAQRRAREEEQRRAQEEEQRRAQEEERRRALHQAQLDRSRQMEEYEARKRAHHEKYRKMLEQRRLEVQRRRAEMERRRAELIARQEASKDYEAERARDLSEMLDTEDFLSQTDMNDSGEISEYPERLPAPRPLSKEEVENDDS